MCHHPPLIINSILFMTFRYLKHPPTTYQIHQIISPVYPSSVDVCWGLWHLPPCHPTPANDTYNKPSERGRNIFLQTFNSYNSLKKSINYSEVLPLMFHVGLCSSVSVKLMVEVEATTVVERCRSSHQLAAFQDLRLVSNQWFIAMWKHHPCPFYPHHLSIETPGLMLHHLNPKLCNTIRKWWQEIYKLKSILVLACAFWTDLVVV